MNGRYLNILYMCTESIRYLNILYIWNMNEMCSCIDI